MLQPTGLMQHHWAHLGSDKYQATNTQVVRIEFHSPVPVLLQHLVIEHCKNLHKFET